MPSVEERDDDHPASGRLDDARPDAEWLAVTTDELPVGAAYEWAVLPDCGAVVLFSGTVRDHAEGRAGVERLTYEAYEEHVVPKLADIAAEVRRRWTTTGRIALLHRLGELSVGESSVVVVVSAPHRAEAFEAARYAIDALKQVAPIWKHEVWAGGSDWGTRSNDVITASAVGGD